MAIDATKDYKISGEKFVKRFSSSEWAERGFCSECGTSLFFEMKKSKQPFFMLGLFGDLIAPMFEKQLYADEKPKCYSFANETELVTKAEMNEQLEAFLAKR